MCANHSWKPTFQYRYGEITEYGLRTIPQHYT